MEGAPPDSGRSSDLSSDDRLDSWKEIAAYLKRDVTTVRRWERREAMPVHRHIHDKLGSVYAFRSELDAWTRSRKRALTQDTSASPASQDQSEAPSKDVEAADATRRGPRIRAGLLASVIAMAIVAAAVTWYLARLDYFWQTPLAHARFQDVTDVGSRNQSAAVSRDGRFVAFLADRDGQLDVFVTQLGAGVTYNLTRGRFPALSNPSIRTLDFSPDGALVTFWTRGVEGSSANSNDISVWAVPTLGGQPRPYLEGVAEFDWSPDGTRLAYHTPGPGDPTYVRDSSEQDPGTQIFTAASGLHAHFPRWSPDGRFVYFVQGQLPDAMDIWRIRPTGGPAERVTSHNARVSHPVFLDGRTLMYLVADNDGSGPWLTTMDVERRVAHRASTGPDRYTSLAAAADGRRIVATVENRKGSLWRLPLAHGSEQPSAPMSIPLTTGHGFGARLGPGFVIYVSSKGERDGIWKLADGKTTELWSAPGARLIGGPELSRDKRQIAFSVEQRNAKRLMVMGVDGGNARVITDALDLRGSPAWAPDGQATASAAQAGGVPRLFRISLAGAVTPLVQDYAMDPVWSANGDLLVYSGADVGTRFPVRGVTAAGKPSSVPDLTLTRGARRLRFVPGRQALIVLRGEIEHKDLWEIDLETGAERRLTTLPADFDVQDFDVSPDGREVILERVEEQSHVVTIDLGSLPAK